MPIHGINFVNLLAYVSNEFIIGFDHKMRISCFVSILFHTLFKVHTDTKKDDILKYNSQQRRYVISKLIDSKSSIQ